MALYAIIILVAVFTTAYAGYLLIRLMVEHPAAALTLGLIALTSLYILDIAAITLLLLFIGFMFQQHRWRTANFWKITLIFGVATIIALATRSLPILQSAHALTSALQQKYDALHLQTDAAVRQSPSSGLRTACFTSAGGALSNAPPFKS